MFKKVLAVLVLILASFMLSGAVALTAHIILRHDFAAGIVLGIRCC